MLGKQGGNKMKLCSVNRTPQKDNVNPDAHELLSI